jgi:hypothetical protein
MWSLINLLATCSFIASRVFYIHESLYIPGSVPFVANNAISAADVYSTALAVKILMNGGCEIVWKEDGTVYFTVLSRFSSLGTEEKHE